MDKVELFKPEDFAHDADEPLISSRVSDIANAKFNRWLNLWPTVYGSHPSPYWYVENLVDFDKDKATSKGIIVLIEELKKEPKTVWMCYTKTGEVWPYTSLEKAKEEMRDGDVIVEFREVLK